MPESPLERLVGTWDFEPFVEGRSMGRGRATFEWIVDGAFLLERSRADWTDPGWVEMAPVSNTVGYGLRRHDLRGHPALRRRPRRLSDLPREADRRRVAAREGRREFHQRFVGAFRDGGRTIEGQWEASPGGTAWNLDLPITYCKTS